MLRNNGMALIIHGGIINMTFWTGFILHHYYNLDADVLAQWILLACIILYVAAGTLLEIQKTSLRGFASVSFLFILLAVFLWLDLYTWDENGHIVELFNYPTYAAYMLLDNGVICGNAPYVPLNTLLFTVFMPSLLLWSGLEFKTYLLEMVEKVYGEDDPDLPSE